MGREDDLMLHSKGSQLQGLSIWDPWSRSRAGGLELQGPDLDCPYGSSAWDLVALACKFLFGALRLL